MIVVIEFPYQFIYQAILFMGHRSRDRDPEPREIFGPRQHRIRSAPKMERIVSIFSPNAPDGSFHLQKSAKAKILSALCAASLSPLWPCVAIFPTTACVETYSSCHMGFDPLAGSQQPPRHGLPGQTGPEPSIPRLSGTPEAALLMAGVLLPRGGNFTLHMSANPKGLPSW